MKPNKENTTEVIETVVNPELSPETPNTETESPETPNTDAEEKKDKKVKATVNNRKDGQLLIDFILEGDVKVCLSIPYIDIDNNVVNTWHLGNKISKLLSSKSLTVENGNVSYKDLMDAWKKPAEPKSKMSEKLAKAESIISESKQNMINLLKSQGMTDEQIQVSIKAVFPE